MCDCDKFDASASEDDGHIHYSYKDEDFLPPKFDDGLHAFLKILRRDHTKILYSRIVLVEVIDNELRSNLQVDLIIDGEQLLGSLDLSPLKINTFKVNDQIQSKNPSFSLSVNVELPNGKTLTLTDEFSFEGVETSDCFYIERKCKHSRCCNWTGCYPCRYRCEARACSCGGHCGPWKHDGACGLFCKNT